MAKTAKEITEEIRGEIKGKLLFDMKLVSPMVSKELEYNANQLAGEILRYLKDKVVIPDRERKLPIENSDVEAMYAGIFNANYPSVAGANEVVVAERIADAMGKYKSRLRKDGWVYGMELEGE